MRMFLLSPETRLYYAGRDRWVPHPGQARDFQEDVQVAIQRCLEEKLLPVELVFCYDNPPRTYNMLLRD